MTSIVRLPNDISRCSGSRCDVREACARHVAESRFPVPITDYSSLGPAVDRADICENFIQADFECA